MELAGAGLVYAMSRRSPFPGTGVRVAPERFRIFASTQDLQSTTVHQLAVSHFGAGVMPFDVGPPSDQAAQVAEGEGVIVIAHLDRRGHLAEQLNRWKFPRAKAVILLFCSSGHYQLARGPFVDGVALKIRDKLHDEAVVVGSRIPVEPSEAVRLAGELLSEAHREQPLAAVVTHYVQRHGKGKPFEVPWVILA